MTHHPENLDKEHGARLSQCAKAEIADKIRLSERRHGILQLLGIEGHVHLRLWIKLLGNYLLPCNSLPMIHVCRNKRCLHMNQTLEKLGALDHPVYHLAEPIAKDP